ncbi:hypothetical protein H696_04037 [Fonticula alba]|uniref:Mitochondrial-processing peptidase subunit alpha n=1 Tax=Fonticula alba TaxID=691883 RepID=A0A058Z6R5_FONAL|nr:hypothetical protein H696_04037 [Fonticula alba]KCV69618.1 hypothetical protein H696_04037 [Fonticula alba]|eukprot:XP_009496183.1 hypothetical protein H696_04037 [Fonticula alba]
MRPWLLSLPQSGPCGVTALAAATARRALPGALAGRLGRAAYSTDAPAGQESAMDKFFSQAASRSPGHRFPVDLPPPEVIIPGYSSESPSSSDKARTTPILQPLPGFAGGPDAPAPVTNSNSLSNQLFKTQLTTLPSGLKVATTRTGAVVINTGVFVRSGTRYDNLPHSGLAQYLDLHALRGTTNLPHDMVSKRIIELGGMLTFGSDRELTICQTSVMPADLYKSHEFISDIIRNPLFSEAAHEECTYLAPEQLRMLEEMPTNYAGNDLLHQVAFGGRTSDGVYTGGRPLGQALATSTPPSLDAVRQFHANLFRPENALVAFVGGVDHDQMVDLVHDMYETQPWRTPDPQVVDPSTIITNANAEYIGGEFWAPSQPPNAMEPLPTSHLVLGFESPGYNDPAFFALSVATFLLGGGASFSSGGPGKGVFTRLYRNVLCRHPWVNLAFSHSMPYRETGIFYVYASFSQGREKQMARIVLHELMGLMHVLPEELQRAKNQLRSAIFMGLESSVNNLDDTGRQCLYYSSRMSAEETIARLDAVTTDDLAMVAQRLLGLPGCLDYRFNVPPRVSDILDDNATSPWGSKGFCPTIITLSDTPNTAITSDFLLSNFR